MSAPPPYSANPSGTSITPTQDSLSDHLPDYYEGVRYEITNETSPPPEYRPDLTEVTGIYIVDPQRETVDVPPDYQRTQTADVPPSYESLFGRVKAVRETATERLSFCQNCSSSAFTVTLLVVLSVIPVAEIIIGSIYIHDCPAVRYIPVYLVVFGVFCLIKALSMIGKTLHRSRTENEEGGNNGTNACDHILNVFLLVWFILGNHWVYGASSWDSDPQSPVFCHPTVYYFAYWTITSFYIVCGAACVSVVALVCLCGRNRTQT